MTSSHIRTYKKKKVRLFSLESIWHDISVFTYLNSKKKERACSGWPGEKNKEQFWINNVCPKGRLGLEIRESFVVPFCGKRNGEWRRLSTSGTHRWPIWALP